MTEVKRGRARPEVPIRLGAKSLRDEFAMAALTGLASAHDSSGSWSTSANAAAVWAYEFADAMMRERLK